MARGVRVSSDVRERIHVMKRGNVSTGVIARLLGIGESTVRLIARETENTILPSKPGRKPSITRRTLDRIRLMAARHGQYGVRRIARELGGGASPTSVGASCETRGCGAGKCVGGLGSRADTFGHASSLGRPSSRGQQTCTRWFSRTRRDSIWTGLMGMGTTGGSREGRSPGSCSGLTVLAKEE